MSFKQPDTLANIGSLAWKSAVLNFFSNRLFPLSIFTVALGLWLDQFLMALVQAEMSSMRPSGMVWVLAVTSAFWSLLWPLFVFALNVFLMTQLPMSQFLTRFTQLIKESFRAIGITVLWSFVLILPGLYKFLQFVLVSPICLLNSQYQLGKVDALSLSAKLSRGHLLKIFGLALVFLLLAPALLQSFDDKTIFETGNYLWALTFAFIEFLILFSYAFVLINFYLKREAQHESHVQSL